MTEWRKHRQSSNILSRKGTSEISGVFFCCVYMKPYAEKFYKSQAWQNTRNAYAKSVGGLCEICLSKGIYKAGEIVHHKTHITPDNINDPNITLDWNNLTLVCRECHTELHDRSHKRYKVDALGRVSAR